MRIKSIYVNNFKSLVDFKIDLAKFNCLIGLNGSGKSTFLQFMDFLAQLMKGEMRNWAQKRGWPLLRINNSVEFFKDSGGWNIKFKVIFADSEECECGYWSGEFITMNGFGFVKETISCNGFTLTSEINTQNDSKLLKDAPLYSCSVIENETGKQLTEDNNVFLQKDASILSILSASEIFNAFKPVKDFICNVDVFEQLSPVEMRRASKSSDSTIGLHGGYLGAFLHSLEKEKLADIKQKLSPFFPFLEQIVATDDRIGHNNMEEGWELWISEKYPGAAFAALWPTEINDGLLRLIAYLAQLESSKSFLLFDEIENGINPELVDFLLKEFLNAKQQIVVTTHSPLFLNYLEDDKARESVKYFYKTPEGYSQCIPFFEIPSIAEKLGVMGPGEAFADTDLVGLAREISRIIAKGE